MEWVLFDIDQIAFQIYKESTLLALICAAFFCPALKPKLPNFWKILPGPLGQN